MRVIRAESLTRSLQKLPREIQRLYFLQEAHFQSEWRDPRLHVKKVRGLPRVFSFRVTRRYRVLFYFQTPDTAICFDIDHRKDIYD